ncbi:MAG: hypothetical protein LBJ35_02190 [Spirochaetaceae bacterium]|nr:hypothetical protein [Spirochaetaceae bacterium]
MAAIFLFLFLIFFPKRGVAVKPYITKSSVVGAVSEGRRGDARTCPICAARFDHGDMIKSKIFPPSGRPYRLLHILGCKFCLNGERERLCPVCGIELSVSDYLVARIWQNPPKPQVRIQGCVHCMVSGGRH